MDALAPSCLPGIHQFTLDTAHSRLSFSARAFGVRRVTGTLLAREGVVELNDGYLSASGVADAASVSTGLRARDWHLRHSHYLDAARWPDIRLDVLPTPFDASSTTAQLTVRGVMVEVPLNRISLEITADGTIRALLAGEFARSALPMLPPIAGVSRLVRVELDAVAHR